jgi:hypothetical protein
LTDLEKPLLPCSGGFFVGQLIARAINPKQSSTTPATVTARKL